MNTQTEAQQEPEVIDAEFIDVTLDEKLKKLGDYIPNIAKTNVVEQGIAKIKEEFKVVPDCTTKEGLEECKLKLRTLVSIRTTADKYHKDAKKPAQDFISGVNDEYKKIVAACKEREEAHKKERDAEQARIDAEKEAKARQEAIRVANINQLFEQFSFTYALLKYVFGDI